MLSSMQVKCHLTCIRVRPRAQQPAQQRHLSIEHTGAQQCGLIHPLLAQAASQGTDRGAGGLLTTHAKLQERDYGAGPGGGWRRLWFCG